MFGEKVEAGELLEVDNAEGLRLVKLGVAESMEAGEVGSRFEVQGSSGASPVTTDDDCDTCEAKKVARGMPRNQLMEELAIMGVDFHKNATKVQLETLYVQALGEMVNDNSDDSDENDVLNPLVPSPLPSP
jgi:hypothetical protein